MNLPDAAAEFARQLAAALAGETGRDKRGFTRTEREVRELREALHRAELERDDLLHAARAVTRPATWTATRMATLRAVVDRIDKGSTAEVCVDRAERERERDELLAAVDDVQRDPSVPVIGSVRRLVELAGTIRRRLRAE